MSLVRSWRAAVLRASGAVLLVPVGLLLAVALAASLTGVGGIGSIGQLVAGPGLPPASIAEALGGVGAGDEHTAVPAVPSLTSGATARRRSGQAAPRRSSEPQGQRRSQRQGRRPTARRPGSTRPPSRPATPPAAPAPAGPSASEPLPGPPRATGLIRRIGAQVNRIVRPIPAVGPAAADAVNTVVQLLDPPPSAPPPSPAAKLLAPAG